MIHIIVQVDNPVCMLSQDTSRNFLHSSNPGDKFKLFMKGTHLEKIKLDFTAVQEQQSLMKQEIERKIKMLPELQAKAKHYEQELQGGYGCQYCCSHIYSVFKINCSDIVL